MFRREEETWKHVWEDCGRWGAEGGWEEMVEKVLGEEGEGEEWLRKLEVFREEVGQRELRKREKGEMSVRGESERG